MFDDLDIEALFGTSNEQTDSKTQEDYANDYEDGAPLSDKKGVAKMQYFMNYLGEIEDENECSGVC